MGDQRNILNNCHSWQNTSVSTNTQPQAFSKSDLDCSLSALSETTTSSNGTNSVPAKFHPERPKLVYNRDYYKKYEHDEVPVKDSDVLTVDKGSLTNSDLEVLEKRIYKNVSRELQTDDDSLGSLESNIKFFKITVEKLFDNFYTSMRDIEHYKQRFHEILNKSKEGSIDDMEGFIKDMFDHIMSSDKSLAKISRHSVEIVTEIEDKTHVSSCGDSAADHDSSKDLLETAFRNDHYLSDSTDETSCKTKKLADLEEKFNIFILSSTPCLDINLFGRNMMSEINMTERQTATQSIASADNLRKVAAKKLELERHLRHEDNIRNISDRDIPVKISFAKKNIHLNEDFSRMDYNEASKSFLSKFCSLLCRKFRRSTV